MYVDPAGPNYRPPNLIEELTRFHTTKAVVPGENQLTATLAWLLDRSQVFAREFAGLYLESEVLDGVTRFGTQTQVKLPSHAGTSLLRPDLSLAGNSGSFELLIEVKVGATPIEYPVGEHILLQPDMYAGLWRLRPSRTQAKVRRVGTLTNGFEFPSPADSWRTADVHWQQAQAVLRGLLDSGSIEPGVKFVARDFCEVVSHVVLREPAVSAEHRVALQRSAVPLLAQVRDSLVSAVNVLPGRPTKHVDGVGVFLRRPDEFELWIIVTPRGGHYNAFGNPDCVGIRLTETEEKPFKDEPRVLAGSFERVRTPGGPHDIIYLELETVDGVIADADAIANHVVETTLAALRACRPPLI